MIQDYLSKDDMTLVCIEPDCGKEFIFKADEQDYYKAHDLTFPKRCRDCRRRRKMLGRKI